MHLRNSRFLREINVDSSNNRILCNDYKLQDSLFSAKNNFDRVLKHGGLYPLDCFLFELTQIDISEVNCNYADVFDF